jgi:hypothetical protein
MWSILLGKGLYHNVICEISIFAENIFRPYCVFGSVQTYGLGIAQWELNVFMTSQQVHRCADSPYGTVIARNRQQVSLCSQVAGHVSVDQYFSNLLIRL